MKAAAKRLLTKAARVRSQRPCFATWPATIENTWRLILRSCCRLETRSREKVAVSQGSISEPWPAWVLTTVRNALSEARRLGLITMGVPRLRAFGTTRKHRLHNHFDMEFMDLDVALDTGVKGRRFVRLQDTKKSSEKENPQSRANGRVKTIL